MKPKPIKPTQDGNDAKKKIKTYLGVDKTPLPLESKKRILCKFFNTANGWGFF